MDQNTSKITDDAPRTSPEILDESTPPLRQLLHYMRPYRGRVRLATFYSFMNKVFDLAPEMLIGVAVDIVVNQEDSILAKIGVVAPLHQLITLAIITAIVWALESVFQYLWQIVWRNLAQRVEHDLRMDMYRHVQDLDLAWYEDRSSGELLATLNDDVNQLERFLDHGANDIIQVLTTVVIIGAVFFYLAPGVAWMSFLPIPFILWGSFRFQHWLMPLYADVRDRVGTLSSRLANNLGGIVTIKSYTAEADEAARVAVESDRYQQANRRAIRLSSAFVPVIRMVIALGFIATLVAGGMMTMRGELGVGSFSVMVFLTQRLLWPLTRLGETFDLYQRAMASTRRAMRLMRVEATILDGAKSLDADAVKGELCVEHLSFAYADGSRVLQDIALHVPAGETAAVVGSTGSGKTTLLKLLMRFYDPTDGQILLDGHALNTLKVRDVRQSIGFVSQDVFLFHGTVRENIAYGRPDASFDEIQAAAKSAEAHEFIMSLPQGYDTFVGERGQKLSGGQRQRISIARAILKDPPILMFDEATSAVDNETEAAIQRSLQVVSQNRTTIVIAHRLSTVRHADRIHVLDKGRLVESGTHDQLLALEGVYANLWRVQTGERSITELHPKR